MALKTKKAKVIIENEAYSDNPESEDEQSDSNSVAESKAVLNEGWADSIAKILRTNKPKNKKTLVLSKAKKLTDHTKKVRTESYEIATAEGQVKQEQTIVEQAKEIGPLRKKKRELPNVRVKPNILEKDRERTLQKIATKGVVQLFNAVKIQQKDISQKLNEAGPLEVRKEKVLKNIDKRAFLDVLMGEKSHVVDEDLKHKVKRKEASWDVLREDFLMSAKMKDWDKELENEESSKEMEVESD